MDAILAVFVVVSAALAIEVWRVHRLRRKACRLAEQRRDVLHAMDCAITGIRSTLCARGWRCEVDISRAPGVEVDLAPPQVKTLRTRAGWTVIKRDGKQMVPAEIERVSELLRTKGPDALPAEYIAHPLAEIVEDS